MGEGKGGVKGAGSVKVDGANNFFAFSRDSPKSHNTRNGSLYFGFAKLRGGGRGGACQNGGGQLFSFFKGLSKKSQH